MTREVFKAGRGVFEVVKILMTDNFDHRQTIYIMPHTNFSGRVGSDQVGMDDSNDKAASVHLGWE